MEWILSNISTFLPLVMAISFSLTLVIEIVVALILKVRSFKNIIYIFLANLMTNPLLVSLVYYINLKCDQHFFTHNYPTYIALAVLELLAFFIEARIYKKHLKYNTLNPYALSLILNACSFMLVGLVNQFIYY